MGVDQPECGAGRSSPAKWSNTNTGEKNSETFGRRDVGCKLVMLKMACSQSGRKVQTHFSASPVRAIRGAGGGGGGGGRGERGGEGEGGARGEGRTCVRACVHARAV
jgi:hypothetical protein